MKFNPDPLFNAEIFEASARSVGTSKDSYVRYAKFFFVISVIMNVDAYKITKMFKLENFRSTVNNQANVNTEN